ncbi:MAG: hypothetical protein HDQ44_03900 [Desulfovibrio sp.]|nr:hypothetical protein [Desulfovibrio sp.]
MKPRNAGSKRWPGLPQAICALGLCAILLAPGCARKTGSLQVGPNQPGLAVDGDEIRLNPELLGVEAGQGFSIDTYSDGSIAVKLSGKPEPEADPRGKAW